MSENQFWIRFWLMLMITGLILIGIGTLSRYLSEKHDQYMAEQGYSKVTVEKCKDITVQTEYIKLNIEGEK